MFITFEGGEAAGKTTQIERLARTLGAEHTLCLTREPGGTPLGEAVRQLLLSPEHTGMDAPCEALLYAASRAQHVDKVILPALGRGEIVLCDRYVDSSLAYQGYGRGLDPEWLRAVNHAACQKAMPRRTYLLSIPPAEALARKRGRLDRLEREELSFHERIHEGFLCLAAAEPGRFLVLDARRSPDDLAREIAEDVRGVLG